MPVKSTLNVLFFLKAPSICRHAWQRPMHRNLFLMRLPLLLLLEMAGTGYIIAEGGKTHTFQRKTQAENIPAVLSSQGPFRPQTASRTGPHRQPRLAFDQTQSSMQHLCCRQRKGEEGILASPPCTSLWCISCEDLQRNATRV